MTFGKMIADAAERRGVTRYELAKRLGVVPSRALQIVKSRNLSERVVRECADALGLDVECKLVRRRDGKK